MAFDWGVLSRKKIIHFQTNDSQLAGAGLGVCQSGSEADVILCLFHYSPEVSHETQA